MSKQEYSFMSRNRYEYNSLGYIVIGGKIWQVIYLVLPNRTRPFYLGERRIQ